MRNVCLLLSLILAACGGGGGSGSGAVSDAASTPGSAATVAGAAAQGGSGSNASGAPGAPAAPDASAPVAPPGSAAPQVRAGAPEFLHILSNGENLAVGEQARPSLSKSQPYGNLMLSPDLHGTAGPLRPLVEGDGTIYSPESPSSGMANSLRAWDSEQRTIVVGLHGRPGLPYSHLKKGGLSNAYADGIAQAAATKTLVEKDGGTYRPIGITIVHGETDFVALSGDKYEGFLKEWQNDYQTDVNALTGSNSVLPMFISQLNTGATGEIAVAQYRAAKNNPDRIFLVGPKYQFEYAPDRLYLSNVDSRQLGELYAKVIKQVVLDGKAWRPLMPNSVQRSGNIVTIGFDIPTGALKLDTKNVELRPNFGFEFVQTGGSVPVTIRSVDLVDSNTKIQLTLSAVPDGSEQKVRYAWRCNGGGAGFQACGRASEAGSVGGNVRDSDETVSPASDGTGLPLHNWLVTFEEAVISAAGQSGGGGASGASTNGTSTTTAGGAAGTSGSTGSSGAGSSPIAPTGSSVTGSADAVTALLGPGTSIAAWGDSLTSGDGGIPFPTQLAAYAPGRTIYNGGGSGQNTWEIMGRQGALPVRLSLLGNRIPADGAVDVNPLTPNLLDLSYRGPVYGSLAGVPGRLERSLSGYPASFVRDLPGNEVAVPPESLFVVDDRGMRSWINVFWVGRNGVHTSVADVESAISAGVASLPTPRRFIVLSVLNNIFEPRGSALYPAVMQLNADLARQFPDNFIDVRAALISQHDPNSAQDLADVLNDLVPSSLRVDGVHLNTKGYGIVARRVAEFIAARGW